MLFDEAMSKVLLLIRVGAALAQVGFHSGPRLGVMLR